MTHLRVEENSWTSCVVWVSDLGATAIERILAYGTKGSVEDAKDSTVDAVSERYLTVTRRGVSRFLGSVTPASGQRQDAGLPCVHSRAAGLTLRSEGRPRHFAISALVQGSLASPGDCNPQWVPLQSSNSWRQCLCPQAPDSSRPSISCAIRFVSSTDARAAMAIGSRCACREYRRSSSPATRPRCARFFSAIPTRFMPARRIVRSARSWASGRRCSSTAPSICASAGCCCRHFMASGWRRTPMAMRAAADNAIASWPIGQQFPIHPQMRAITFETIIRAVFGFRGRRVRLRVARPDARVVRALLEQPRHAVLSARDAHRRGPMESVGAGGQADRAR